MLGAAVIMGLVDEADFRRVAISGRNRIVEAGSTNPLPPGQKQQCGHLPFLAPRAEGSKKKDNYLLNAPYKSLIYFSEGSAHSETE